MDTALVPQLKRKLSALRRRVSPPEERDIRYNLNQLQILETALNRHGRSLSAFQSILEFGCGYGRLTQHLFRLASQARIFGCDVSADDIARCRRRYPNGHFFVNRVHPPLPLDDGIADFIFSYSVFTHLSEPNHRAWLKELARILRPGGVMLHTTHSGLALKLMARFSPQRLANYRLGMEVEEFLALGPGFHYVPYSAEQPEYGLAILSRGYVSEAWPQATGLRLLEYAEGGIAAFPEGCQDLVVMG